MSKADQHKNAFLEEAYELIAELETSLLELEDVPDNSETTARVFRALHTIKGSGAMFGFDEISRFTHEVETVFDLVRNGDMSVSKELIDLTLAARDHIKNLLDRPDNASEYAKDAHIIVESLRRLVPRADDQNVSNSCSEAIPDQEVNEDVIQPADAARNITYRIRFRPSPDIFAMGNNPLLLLAEMRDLGECEIIAHKDSIPYLDEIDPESCYTYWDMILTTSQGINSIKDVFIFVEDNAQLDIDVIDDSGGIDEETLADIFTEKSDLSREDIEKMKTSYKRLGEILVERDDITREDLSRILGEQKRVGDLLVEAGLVDRAAIESALAEQKRVQDIRKKQDAAQHTQINTARQRKMSSEAASSIRVASEKLDKLVDLVGELVTVQARLTQTASSSNDPDLLTIAEEVESLTNELRDNTMSVRMVPIGSLFSKFRRLVRDLATETGKEVEMTTEGAETELDKTVIERLTDPLVHLIRNSIDHGIELPDARASCGKPRTGTIQLSARHSGANVLIEINDDGAGLNAEAIRAKAIEKGLADPGADLSAKEIYSLILAPGFSTAHKVSSVSGRGVGMDVVKQNIEALRGSIEITSQQGVGTAIMLKLPLTLAIIDGLLVKLAEEFFVMPLSLVEECVELTKQDIKNAHGRQIANVRGEIVPYISLREQFSINGNIPDIEQVVIAAIDDQRVGFVVDDVVGEHQTVIKTLGKFYKDVEGLSGATILGDGRVALILDVPKLFQKVEGEEILAGGMT